MDGEASGHELQVYAQMENGRLTRLRALSASCPVASAGSIDDLGVVDTDASVDWLMSSMGSDEDLATDIMAAIAFHAGPGSVPALASILEDRSLDREIRGEALFWLVQNGSDDALAYLDRILAAR